MRFDNSSFDVYLKSSISIQKLRNRILGGGINSPKGPLLFLKALIGCDVFMIIYVVKTNVGT